MDEAIAKLTDLVDNFSINDYDYKQEAFIDSVNYWLSQIRDNQSNRDKERMDWLESLNIVVAGCDDVSNGCFLGDTSLWWDKGEASLREAIDKEMSN